MASTDILELPAYPPPPGVTAQIGHAPNGNKATVGILVLCLSLTSMAVILRVYSRFFLLRKVQVQDYLMLLAFALYITLNGLYFHLVQYPGWFIHIWDLTVGEFIEFAHFSVVSSSLWLGLHVPIKTAILLEWISVFIPGELLLVNLACTPYEYAWNHTIEGHCTINTTNASLAASVFAFATDSIIFFIPQRIIWTLNMTWRRKAGVSVVFALGLAGCTASILRLYYTVPRATSFDLSYHFSSIHLTAIGEGAAALLVFCVPAAPKALAALNLSQLIRSLPPWSSLGSVIAIRRYPSQDSKISVSALSSLAHKKKGAWKVGPGSENCLEPLGRPSARRLSDDVEMATKFRTSEQFEHDPTLITQENSRQDPWVHQ